MDDQRKVKKMPMKLDSRQYRAAELGLIDSAQTRRIDTEYYVEGYATTFAPYELYRDETGQPVYEYFPQEAFANTDMSDVIMQYDHEGRVFARMSNGSLLVEVDEHGLFVAADLGRTAAGRALYEEIEQGMTCHMSWGFRTDDYEYDKKTRTITHKAIHKIYDVSAVSLPANEQTEIHARAFADGVIEQVQQELRAQELERQKLALRITLEVEK